MPRSRARTTSCASPRPTSRQRKAVARARRSRRARQEPAAAGVAAEPRGRQARDRVPERQARRVAPRGRRWRLTALRAQKAAADRARRGDRRLDRGDVRQGAARGHGRLRDELARREEEGRRLRLARRAHPRDSRTSSAMKAEGRSTSPTPGRSPSGQTVRFRLEAHPDIEFTGKIASILSTVQRQIVAQSRQGREAGRRARRHRPAQDAPRHAVPGHDRDRPRSRMRSSFRRMRCSRPRRAGRVQEVRRSVTRGDRSSLGARNETSRSRSSRGSTPAIASRAAISTPTRGERALKRRGVVAVAPSVPPSCAPRRVPWIGRLAGRSSVADARRRRRRRRSSAAWWPRETSKPPKRRP